MFNYCTYMTCKVICEWCFKFKISTIQYWRHNLSLSEKAFALSSLSRNAKSASKKHHPNLPTSEKVITHFNILRIHINVCTFNEWLNRTYNWGNNNGAENRTLQKVILHNQKLVHEQEPETELTELVNIIDSVFSQSSVPLWA
jgi:hypothetical protein